MKEGIPKCGYPSHRGTRYKQGTPWFLVRCELQHEQRNNFCSSTIFKIQTNPEWHSLDLNMTSSKF